MSANNPPSALELWKEKLAEYQRELAIASDPERKFQLRKLIQECIQQIQQLEQLSVNTPQIEIFFSKLSEPDINPQLNYSISSLNFLKSKFYNLMAQAYEQGGEIKVTVGEIQNWLQELNKAECRIQEILANIKKIQEQ